LDHSYSTSIQSVEENCTHDHSYVKDTSVTTIPVIDHSKGHHSYADVVKLGNKHQHKHVGDHSYACTVEENGALHNKNNETSIISNPQIDKQDCVIEDGVFHDNLSKNPMASIDHIPGDFNSVNKTIKIPPNPSVVLDTDKTNDKHVTQTRPIEPTADQNCVQQLVLADIKNMPSQLTYVDNNPFLSYSVPGDGNWVFFIC
jgi:hypothetical protein